MELQYTICTSGLVYDAIFSHNGPYGAGDASMMYVQSDSPGGSTDLTHQGTESDRGGAKSLVYNCVVAVCATYVY